MIKKITAFFLAVGVSVLFLTGCGTSVDESAEETSVISDRMETNPPDPSDIDHCGRDLTWILDDDGILTISGNGKMYDYSVYDDDPVTPPWYDSCDKILEVIIEEGVTTVGIEAFEDCANLTDVMLPDSVTIVREWAFGFCYSLKSIELGPHITDVEEGAFCYCTALETVTFTGDAPSFGEACFMFVEATVYYPDGNDTWTKDVRQNYEGTLKWKARGQEAY